MSDVKEMKDDKYEDWKVEDAASTLLRAEEIKQDSKMMSKVAPLLAKKKKAITSIADLKKVREERAMEEEEDASEE